MKKAQGSSIIIKSTLLTGIGNHIGLWNCISPGKKTIFE
jgi:hypothetical protein